MGESGSYVTDRQCDTRRLVCPGSRAVPLRVLVPVLLALFGAVCFVFIFGGSQRGTMLEAQTRTEQNVVRLETKNETTHEHLRRIEGTQQELLRAVAKIDKALTRLQP